MATTRTSGRSALGTRERREAEAQRAAEWLRPAAGVVLALIRELGELAEGLEPWRTEVEHWVERAGWPPPSLMTSEAIAAWVRWSQAYSVAEDIRNAPYTNEEEAEYDALGIVAMPFDAAAWEAQYGPMDPPPSGNEMVSRQLCAIRTAFARLPDYIAAFERIERAWRAGLEG